MLRFNDNPNLITLCKTLENLQIISLNDKRIKPTLISAKIFDDLLFVTFIIWVVQGLREDTDRIINFLKLDSDQTLLLIKPTEKYLRTIFYTSNQQGYIQNDFFDAFVSNIKVVDFCPICNGLRYNASLISSKKDINISKQAPFFSADCLTGHKNLKKWLVENIKLNINNGWYFGGFPKIFGIPFETIELILHTPDIDKLLDQLISVYLASKFMIKGFTANTEIRKPFSSFELDAVLCDHGDIDDINSYKLFVLETTNGFEVKVDDKDDVHLKYGHIKNKFLTYQVLEDLECLKFRYCYASLLNIEFDAKNSASSTLNYMAKNSPDFELFSIEENFPNFILDVKSDNIDFTKFKEVFNFYMKKIEDSISKVLSYTQ